MVSLSQGQKYISVLNAGAHIDPHSLIEWKSNSIIFPLKKLFKKE